MALVLVGMLGVALAACVSGSPGAVPKTAPEAVSEREESVSPVGLTPTSSASASARDRIELILERAPERDEAVHVRVSAGVLPDGAEIAVRLSDGELIGIREEN